MSFSNYLLMAFLLLILLRWWWDASCRSEDQRLDNSHAIHNWVEGCYTTLREIRHEMRKNDLPPAKELMEYTEKMFKEFTTVQALKAPRETLVGLAAFQQQRKLAPPLVVETENEQVEMGRNTYVDKS